MFYTSTNIGQNEEKLLGHWPLKIIVCSFLIMHDSAHVRPRFGDMDSGSDRSHHKCFIPRKSTSIHLLIRSRISGIVLSLSC